MFDKLSYKRKFLGVLIGFAILFLASYKKTFKHTLAAKKELYTIEQKLSSIDHSYNQLYSLKYDINHLDNLIGGHTDKPELVQQQILDFVSNTKLNVNIVSIEDSHLFSDHEFLIYSNQLEFEGAYESLIHILYEIEKNFKNSSVVSCGFHSKTDYATNKQTLFFKIILQNYEKAN